MDMSYLTMDGRPIHQPLAARFDHVCGFIGREKPWGHYTYMEASRVYDATWNACNDAQERILDAIRDGVCPVCGNDYHYNICPEFFHCHECDRTFYMEGE